MATQPYLLSDQLSSRTFALYALMHLTVAPSLHSACGGEPWRHTHPTSSFNTTCMVPCHTTLLQPARHEGQSHKTFDHGTILTRSQTKTRAAPHRALLSYQPTSSLLQPVLGSDAQLYCTRVLSLTYPQASLNVLSRPGQAPSKNCVDFHAQSVAAEAASHWYVDSLLPSPDT